jgi:hypothetical protein
MKFSIPADSPIMSNNRSHTCNHRRLHIKTEHRLHSLTSGVIELELELIYSAYFLRFFFELRMDLIS